MLRITVFSKNACVQCNGTYTKLDKLRLPYEVVNAELDLDAQKFVVETLGYRQMPVVLVHEGPWNEFVPTDDNKDDFWFGHRPDRLTALLDCIEPIAENDDKKELVGANV